MASYANNSDGREGTEEVSEEYVHNVAESDALSKFIIFALSRQDDMREFQFEMDVHSKFSILFIVN